MQRATRRVRWRSKLDKGLLRQRRRRRGFDEGEEAGERPHGGRVERVADPRPGDLADDQPRLLQDAQVLRGGRGRQADLLHEVAADAATAPQQDRKSTRLNSSQYCASRMTYSA